MSHNSPEVGKKGLDGFERPTALGGPDVTATPLPMAPYDDGGADYSAAPPPPPPPWRGGIAGGQDASVPIIVSGGDGDEESDGEGDANEAPELMRVRSCQRDLFEIVKRLEALTTKLDGAHAGIRESTFVKDKVGGAQPPPDHHHHHWHRWTTTHHPPPTTTTKTPPTTTKPTHHPPPTARRRST